jgi:nucleotidyltransferase/DNA polymerase involved in DNA repair
MGTFEEFGKRIDEEVSRLKEINDFESFGKRVDEELSRMKTFMKQEVAPETEKRTAQFLREVSQKLGEAASKIESRHAAHDAKGAPNPPDPPTT